MVKREKNSDATSALKSIGHTVDDLNRGPMLSFSCVRQPASKANKASS